jgi:osmotically-inducible protein OsmY
MTGSDSTNSDSVLTARATAAAPLRSDGDLQSAVREELAWDPSVDSADIDIAVHRGTVSLSGAVSSRFEGVLANRAAQRVDGVCAVIDDLVTRVAASRRRSGTELETAVRKALDGSVMTPEAVRAVVDEHSATLTGEVQWNFEREGARCAIERIEGIDHIDNRITLRRRPAATDAAACIRAALIRNAIVDANSIVVHVEGNSVTLEGFVHSWAQRREAERTTWSSPSITSLKNEIVVRSA